MASTLNSKKFKVTAVAASIAGVLGAGLVVPVTPASSAGSALSAATTTPIQHVVVIFQENVSFDHYFGTYPYAANLPNEPGFTMNQQVPVVNGLGTLVNGQPSGTLLTNNPNKNNPANGSGAINPFRFARSQTFTNAQNHGYGGEQLAFDLGNMDLFPKNLGAGGSVGNIDVSYGKNTGVVMGYYDGNTVGAMWNYAQNFALSDNSYGSTFGPSTIGALNLVAGNTYPATPTSKLLTDCNSSAGCASTIAAFNGSYGTLIDDINPAGDVCTAGASSTQFVQMGNASLPSKNIGDLLNAQGVSWGAFMGGFNLTTVNANGTTGCERSSPITATPGITSTVQDYWAHHAWFQYWPSTANPNHTRPTVPPSQYGTSADTGANHQYDMQDFFAALAANNLPAVSFLKAPTAQTGHAGRSDPLMEQQFLVTTINAIMKSSAWGSTAIIIAYDDSGGWYDHQMSPTVNSSVSSGNDSLTSSGRCGSGAALQDANGNTINGRCGYGPRLPLLVISPYAKKNFVDHTLTDQSSIIRFIEDNWNLGRLGNGSFDAQAGSLLNMFNFSQAANPPLTLDPTTGNTTPVTCLFNWAEQNYSSFLSPSSSAANASSATMQFFVPYVYRYYQNTNSYLGVSSVNNHLYYAGPNTAILDLGAVTAWLPVAGCQ